MSAWPYLSGEALGAHDAVHHGMLVEVKETGIACPGEQVSRQLQDIVGGACLLRLPPFPTLTIHKQTSDNIDTHSF